MFPKNLRKKLEQRKSDNTLRDLGKSNNLVDFSSNDYLGFAKSEEIFDEVHQFLKEHNLKQNGSTGSRLLTGNYDLFKNTENYLAKIHESESALLFNSGYNANLGFFSTILQKGMIVLYDEFIHASIRDGIQLSNANSYKFNHNNCKDLERLILKFKNTATSLFVVTESVFSMDGDTPDLKHLAKICEYHKTYFIVDEAHALGVFKLGLIQKLNLQHQVFARIMTFGKALGCHGAVILGSKELIQFLINFCRTFIYTTGLPPHQLATILVSYKELCGNSNKQRIKKLHNTIDFFKSQIKTKDVSFIQSNSAIQSCIIGGNNATKEVANKFIKLGYDVKPILSPTVPKGKERIRFCIHSYNSFEEITSVFNIL